MIKDRTKQLATLIKAREAPGLKNRLNGQLKRKISTIHVNSMERLTKNAASSGSFCASRVTGPCLSSLLEGGVEPMRPSLRLLLMKVLKIQGHWTSRVQIVFRRQEVAEGYSGQLACADGLTSGLAIFYGPSSGPAKEEEYYRFSCIEQLRRHFPYFSC